MDTVAERTKARFSKAIASLKRALEFEKLPDYAERDATLLRFELAAELMPKALQRILSERGSDVSLPKDIVRAATGAGILEESVGSTLLSVIDDRNRMVHDYGEEYAKLLYERIRKTYTPALEAVLKAI